MENNNKDWRDYNLDQNEIEMLESVEAGEWKSVGNIEERRQALREFFSEKDENIKNINLNLKKEDYEGIIEKSRQTGISYNELIEKLVHNFVIGKILM